MTTTLILSRQPLSSRPLQEWLDDTPDTVVLFTTEKAVADTPEELAKYFPRHRLVADYHAWSSDLAAEQAAREFSVDRIASTSEQDVLRAARLRARLGLPGQSPASAIAYRDKVLMKQLARQAGLPVPAFTAVDSAMDLMEFIDTVGYPVVVKPRSGYGAEGVHVLRDQQGVDAFLAREQESTLPYLPGHWMAEFFVEGDFCHVDGIMSEGRIVHGWPSQYNSGVAEHLEHDSSLSSVLIAAEDPRHAVLMKLTADLIAALPVADGPMAFHLEAWIRADGKPVLCEIASRAGGAGIAQVYERAFGVQLAREGLRAQCGSELTLRHQPEQPEGGYYGWLVIPPGHGTFTPPAGPCPVPGVELSLQLEAGTVCQGVAHAAEGAATALVRGADPAEVAERIDQAVRWWRQSARWA
ncbi:ATP-grasp domain-containing protein [Kitasatospora sp. NBC_01250]|uniref:ATP-grasp domain-containing protein n=1 Tax=unclassified Kitasatospora TaxID=2633591 RepID=UPI002E0D8543|nr:MULTISPECIES: ATP-grasp domain-containing protein [unclassified Kitasatospora]WSJ71264.1 ATP-grasp domain-containing protein [Kitasatospora sp. NBC_01302]